MQKTKMENTDQDTVQNFLSRNRDETGYVSSFWNIHLSLSIVGEGVKTGERVSSRIHNVPSLGVGVLQLGVKCSGIG